MSYPIQRIMSQPPLQQQVNKSATSPNLPAGSSAIPPPTNQKLAQRSPLPFNPGGRAQVYATAAYSPPANATHKNVLPPQQALRHIISPDMRNQYRVINNPSVHSPTRTSIVTSGTTSTQHTTPIQPTVQSSPTAQIDDESSDNDDMKRVPNITSIVGTTEQKANAVKFNMEQIMTTLVDLADKHQELKLKFLATRKHYLLKFFGTSDRSQVLICFHSWKNYKLTSKAVKRHSEVVDQLYYERSAAEKQHKSSASEYENTIKEMTLKHSQQVSEIEERERKSNEAWEKLYKEETSKIGNLEKENVRLNKALDKQYKLLETVSDQIQNCQDENESRYRPPRNNINRLWNVAPPDLSDHTDPFTGEKSSQFLKEQLHRLLSVVDPRYVPPLHHSLFEKKKEVEQAKREASLPPNASTYNPGSSNSVMSYQTPGSPLRLTRSTGML